MPKATQKIKVALTGGGTAGHVMPHLALIPEFNKKGWDFFYIGSSGMEKELIQKTGMRYHCIFSGKLRRYFSLENFFDIFKVFAGFLQSLMVLLRERPYLVFSKGGFVSVPVCYAAYYLRIPVITHESDLTPGLATKLIARIAKHILFAFEETARFFPTAKSSCVGAIIRQDLLQGDRAKGLAFCGFRADDSRPVVLIMGGSLGAQRINEAVEVAASDLLKQFRIVHLTGKGKQLNIRGDGYRAFEFVGPELKDIFAATDLVVARAGANSIFEFLALRKPMLLIPLEIGSRGDQLHNAKSFVDKGWALELREAELDATRLQSAIQNLALQGPSLIKNQNSSAPKHAHTEVVAILENSFGS